MEDSSSSLLSQTLTLADGRSLGFAEYGSSSGSAIVYFHGLPGSRFEARLWAETASRLGYRLIAPDRPGMGISIAQSARKLLDYAHDVTELVNHLSLTSYSIIGVSGGSPYALACATRKELLPGLHSVAIVAGWGPRQLMNRGLAFWQRIAMHLMDVVPSWVVRKLWNLLIGDAARDPDKTVLERRLRPALENDKSLAEHDDKEQLVQTMINNLRAAFCQGAQGYVDDATIISSTPWMFDLGEISDLPISFWYGSRDVLTPASTGRAMSDRVLGSTFVLLDGDDHTASVLRHQDAVLQALSRS